VARPGDGVSGSLPLEDYALLGDTHSSALVSKGGSVDWLGYPRFDSPTFFARLLGNEDNGHWTLAPRSSDVRTNRRYRTGTLVLETEHHTPDGAVRVIDALVEGKHRRLVRMVEGLSGRVPMQSVLRVRFDYGSVVPWVRRLSDGEIAFVAGAESLRLRTQVPHAGKDFATIAEFEVGEGDRVPFELTWHQSHLEAPKPIKVQRAIQTTSKWWSDWSSSCRQDGEWDEAIRDSLVVLKGLSYEPTGGIVAAPTTSLPEHIGGERNWDYRYCWIRDATFTLIALLESGYEDEACSWRDWLLRALAGRPDQMQIMYSVAGERWLPESEVGWLPGYEDSRPIRVGNAASEQFQLDVYGEAMDALHHARLHGLPFVEEAWDIQKVLLDFLEGQWKEPDEGIWEVRGPRRHFTHSKVMAWVGMDRAIKAAEAGADGPVDRWRRCRDEIHADVLANGVDDRGVFVQSYGSRSLDASVLMVPLVGFLPPSDPRVKATVEAIETELMHDGFVRRYIPDDDVDGIGTHEGAFLMCSFWLVDNYALLGRTEDARTLFWRLLSLRNDVGLLAEEYDTTSKRFVGNFPQAISHVALAISAGTLEGTGRGSQRRSGHW
jgi:GH15 family glucan-1,4-alpha-glucosidase